MVNTNRHIIIIILLINVYSALSNIQTLNFFEPGNYTLSKQDYNNSDNLIIEMWGGGSGGYINYYESCNQNGCYQDGYTYYGGNSGAYIKANIITHGESFNLVIGSGGISTKIVIEDNNAGSDTILVIQNKSMNLVAGGGPPPNTSYALAKYYIDSIYGYVMNYANGNVGGTTLSKINNFVNGAAAPYGCSGGTYNNVFNTGEFSHDLLCNTCFAGGGACCYDYSHSRVNQGGNGGIIIYYNTILSPSTSLSPSPTSSVTSSVSVTISRTPSYSITKTKSPSISVTRSPSTSPSTSDVITFEEAPFSAALFFCMLIAGFVITILCVAVGLIKKHKEEVELQRKNKYIKEELNIEEKLKFVESRNSEECLICLTKLETYKCDRFDHFICFECLSKLKYTCPLCKFKFIY